MRFVPTESNLDYENFRYSFFSQTSSTNSLNSPIPASTILTTPSVTAFAGQPFSTNFDDGQIQQWSVNIQYQLSPSRLVEIAYFGSHGTDLNEQILPNQAVPGPGPQVDRRPLSLFWATTIFSGPFGRSNYNSAQLRFEQRPWHGLHFVVHYAFTRALDPPSNLLSNAASPSVPQNSRDIRAEYSRSTFEVRHRFVANGQYHLQFSSSHSGLDRVVGGWSLGWVLTLQSGIPFSPRVPIDRSGTGSYQDRPNLVSDPNDIANRTTAQWFNTAAFVLQPAGTFGNAGRNIIDGPNLRNLDFSVLKDVNITERHHLQFRVEAFNALNRTNFMLPNRQFGTPQFGTISSARDARIMQIAVKYSF